MNDEWSDYVLDETLRANEEDLEDERSIDMPDRRMRPW